MKRWTVVRCWQGVGSTMVPTDTGWRYWTRRGAERMAAKGNALGGPFPGAWYAASRVGVAERDLMTGAYRMPGT